MESDAHQTMIHSELQYIGVQYYNLAFAAFHLPPNVVIYNHLVAAVLGTQNNRK